MKNTKKIQKNDSLFKVLLISITAIFVIGMLIIILNPFEIKSINRIKEIDITEYNKMLDVEDEHHDHDVSHDYIIFVYDSRKTDSFNVSQNEEIERYILDYANYARTHKAASRIYRLDISDSANKTALSTLGLKEANIPGLVVMTNNHSSITISSRYKTIQDVQNYLADLMK